MQLTKRTSDRLAAITYFITHNRSRLGRCIRRSVLTACIGLLLSSCTRSVEAGTQAADQERNAVDMAIANKNEVLLATTNNLEQGIAYSEARALLIDRGWIPHTFATTAPLADWSDPNVQSMQVMGFDEIKSCTHAQADICVFEFVYIDRTLEDGAVLSVLASTANTAAEAPTLWSWGLQNSVSTTYAEQSFEETAFSELQQAGLCVGVAYDCSYQKYAFKDALLISAPYDFGATKLSLLLRQPISKQAALSYAKILDNPSDIDFNTVEVGPNRETYSGCEIALNNGGDAQFSATCFINFLLTPDGKVSEISLHHAVP